MSTFEIVKRYTEENINSNLSCGGNIQYLELIEGEKVLDLGCGRGGETLEASKHVGSSGFAWGLDLTPRMIQLAQERAKQEQVENVDFLVASMDQIPLEDNSLDAVLSNCAINHVEDKVTVYREIYRVLKRGGRFVVSDIMTEQPLPQEIREDPEAIADCFGGAITIQEYENVLKNAGFSQVEVFKERRYMKNGYEMISRTFQGYKEPIL
ncbi:methyltransferase domain-containing protein [Desulfitobacterium metallireducens]|uniref:Arsenite methyltransferase n=1 Tax=Desulfitobacterium metallireducens DSM 15288 TaxID=871968 RepID=W0E726_9FIRM|nr:methyltransferase domain-containing protein [Desulfitobacterium metallireducens]AHF06577.1 ubiquinone biosynthesis protein UbiE [Desulfitobacterium metallireducens DSM 15288]